MSTSAKIVQQLCWASFCVTEWGLLDIPSSDQDRKNRTGRRGQTEEDRQNRTGRTGQAEWDKQNGTSRTEQAELDRQDRASCTGQAEKDRPDRTDTHLGRTGRQKKSGRMGHTEQD